MSQTELGLGKVKKDRVTTSLKDITVSKCPEYSHRLCVVGRLGEQRGKKGPDIGSWPRLDREVCLNPNTLQFKDQQTKDQAW